MSGQYLDVAKDSLSLRKNVLTEIAPPRNHTSSALQNCSIFLHRRKLSAMHERPLVPLGSDAVGRADNFGALQTG
jgi:hypothetical protein